MKLRTEDVTWQEIDGELVILDLAQSSYLTTNKTGAYLANLLLEEQTEESLTAALAAEYELSTESAATDVRAFLEQLREQALLA
ncbi:PqqD family protein [Actinotalea sp. BY-33]|uniref:PqqD family protein n=1 Tax=Actinotalea soli TaxID=2819234 RepID=A0A939LNX0_9CELL|nr:PqqD family protein [Actinotalea soli]MBO1751977.1 PqqD family protein [Actinotalea soli]